MCASLYIRSETSTRVWGIPPPGATIATRLGEPATCFPMRILVVEDERAMASLLRQGLEEANHSVTVARDGLEGLAAYTSLQTLKVMK